MDDNLAKVIAYLESANRGEVTMSEEIIDEAVEDFRTALKKQFTPQDFSFKPRPSNLGKPLCQLQLAKSGARAEDKSYTFKMIVTFGDAVEAILKAVLKSSRVDYKEGTKIDITETMSGETDLYVDDKVDDIKSCSPWAFRNKFLTFDGLKSHDSFGYLTQLHLYSKGAKKKVGGWWAVNKSSGEISYLQDESTKEEVQESIDDALDKVDKLSKDLPFKRCFESVEEKFRKVPTGKRVLGEECYWCDYKFSCWPNLEYKPQEASSAREPRWFYYTNEEEVSNEKNTRS